MSPEISAQIDLIQKLIETGPSIQIKRYYNNYSTVATVEKIRLVTFGYIGNLSRYGDDRRWMVFNKAPEYTKLNDGTVVWNCPYRETTSWGCESNSLTVEKLEEAYKVAEEAIKKAWQFVNDTP